MWVERFYAAFKDGETIRAEDRSNGTRYNGLFRGTRNASALIQVDDMEEGSSSEFSLYYYKFYGWSPSSKPAVDESKIRLHAPFSRLNDLISEAAAPKCAVVQVGEQEYKVKPGDHLRVWWEDGALWSELVQGS